MNGENNNLLPVVQNEQVRGSGNVTQYVRQRAVFGDFVKSALKEGHGATEGNEATEGDFGTIPGCGNRKVLKKSGAEKILEFYGYSVDFQEVKSIENFETGFFYYDYKAIVLDGSGQIVGALIGHCNSFERKYRYQSKYANKLTEWEKLHQKTTTPDKSGKVLVEVEDPADKINTLKKMAQKRALVGAVIQACALSADFTQDLDENEREELESEARVNKAISYYMDKLGMSENEVVAIVGKPTFDWGDADFDALRNFAKTRNEQNATANSLKRKIENARTLNDLAQIKFDGVSDAQRAELNEALRARKAAIEADLRDDNVPADFMGGGN